MPRFKYADKCLEHDNVHHGRKSGCRHCMALQSRARKKANPPKPAQRKEPVAIYRELHWAAPTIDGHLVAAALMRMRTEHSIDPPPAATSRGDFSECA